jgi:predicted CoA-substrate-specific enzyme activase
VAIPIDADAGAQSVAGRATVYTHFDLDGAATRAAAEALKDAGADIGDMEYLAATGYGRYQVDARDIQITEITCHARGAVELMPKLKTILDVGAQNARAVKILPSGRVTRFRMNDKCASGAGRFVERVAKALELELEDVSQLALQADAPCEISSICAVLAESEVINHVTNGETIPNILQGTHGSISDRLVSLVRQVDLEEPFGLTGGVAHNAALLKAIGERLGMKVHTHELSAYAGALGAALLGRQRLHQLAKEAVA